MIGVIVRCDSQTHQKVFRQEPEGGGEPEAREDIYHQVVTIGDSSRPRSLLIICGHLRDHNAIATYLKNTEDYDGTS